MPLAPPSPEQDLRRRGILDISRDCDQRPATLQGTTSQERTDSEMNMSMARWCYTCRSRSYLRKGACCNSRCVGPLKATHLDT